MADLQVLWQLYMGGGSDDYGGGEGDDTDGTILHPFPLPPSFRHPQLPSLVPFIPIHLPLLHTPYPPASSFPPHSPSPASTPFSPSQDYQATSMERAASCKREEKKILIGSWRIISVGLFCPKFFMTTYDCVLSGSVVLWSSTLYTMHQPQCDNKADPRITPEWL